MRLITISGKKVELYDEISEMPHIIFNLFNQYAIKDNEIGSDIYAVSRHFEKLDLFLSKNNIEDAIQERKNLQQTFWSIFSGMNFSAMQLACLVYSIDGEKIIDYNDSGLKKVLDQLPDISQKQIIELIEDQKKSSHNN